MLAFDKIRKDIQENPVLLYMKGTADMPQCGFSATVVQILRRLNIAFKEVDVLKDNEIRQAVKEYSQWPTIPQLYIAGEFVGGCDIVREMYESGELQSLLKDKDILKD